MILFITPGRTPAYARKATPGGYKLYLTDGSSKWVELGGGGKARNPYDLPRQLSRGYETEADAWRFADTLVATNKDVLLNPLRYHTLYPLGQEGELFFARSRSLVEIGSTKCGTASNAQRLYKLVGADGVTYESASKGTLGGYRPRRIYGRLNCSSALRHIRENHYVQHRVFFADEEAAIGAGYRPCGICMREKYRAWKHQNGIA